MLQPHRLENQVPKLRPYIKMITYPAKLSHQKFSARLKKISDQMLMQLAKTSCGGTDIAKSRPYRRYLEQKIMCRLEPQFLPETWERFAIVVVLCTGQKAVQVVMLSLFFAIVSLLGISQRLELFYLVILDVQVFEVIWRQSIFECLVQICNSLIFK